MKLTYNLEDVLGSETEEIMVQFLSGQIYIYLKNRPLNSEPSAVINLVGGNVQFTAWVEDAIEPYVDVTIK